MIKYFTDKETIEPNAAEKILELEKDLGDGNIFVFPDVHYCSERSIPVGIAFSSVDKFYPLVTGKDVACGVMFLRFPTTGWKKPFKKLEHYNALNKASQSFTDEGLGGGNHFLSIENGDDGNTYIICHTGTRNLGIYMYQHFLSLIDEFNYKEGTTGVSLPIDCWTEELSVKYKDVVATGTQRRIQFVTKTLDFLVRNGYVGAVQYEVIDSVHNIFEINGNNAIHRKGATEIGTSPVAIPLSMTRGTLIAEPKKGICGLGNNLLSCAHGAGRKLSRTDTLKYWHSLKKKEKKSYEEKFVEMLGRDGKFPNGYLQEFDFAYKNTDSILADQPFIKKVAKTTPIITIKYTEI